MDAEISTEQRGDVKFIYYVGDFFNILKAFIGTNYQGLPFAFHNAGVLAGLIGVFLIATLTDHCCQLMVRCKYYAIEKILDDHPEAETLTAAQRNKLRCRLGKTLGYGDIGRTVFGEWCYHLIHAAVWFTQFTTCTCYFIFIGNTIMKIYPEVPGMTPLSNSSNNTGPVEQVVGVPMLYTSVLSKRAINYSPEHIQEISFQERLDPNSLFLNETFGLYLQNNNITTTDAGIETGEAPNTTVLPTTTSPGLPPLPLTTANTLVSTAPDLKWLVLFPLPFFIVTSLIRRVRLIAPFSFIATVALGVGAMSVFVWLCVEFARMHVNDSVEFFIHWSHLPLFIGQLISAYEGIGCIIPIESSMEGNRWVFPWFLHLAIYIVFLILASFGIVGYLTYGDQVGQLIVLNLPNDGLVSNFIDVTLILSVLFTYPLQCFPVIEITESYLFGSGKCCTRACCKQRGGEAEDGDTLVHTVASVTLDDAQHGLLASHSLESSINSVSTVASTKASGWQRNIVRFVLTLSIMGLAILCRNAYAYVSAFTGAVGCALLAYIIPCAIHLKVKHGQLSWKNLVKDWGTIIFSIFVSIITLVVIVKQIVVGGPI